MTVCAERTIDAGGAPFVTIRKGAGPIVWAAIHAGHDLRPGLEPRIALDAADRLREEDPFTGLLAPAHAPSIVAARSRFEVDLNRPREAAVYREPADAWGLDVWRSTPAARDLDTALAAYDAFYDAVGELLEAVVAEHGRAVVIDLHSYNHRRQGPEGPVADEVANPEVNLGTSTLGPAWQPVTSAFLSAMHSAGFDARADVKFKGGHFPRWVNERFAGRCGALAVEFKKTFMDEWTGEADPVAVGRIRTALASAVPALQAALAEVGP